MELDKLFLMQDQKSRRSSLANHSLALVKKSPVVFTNNEKINADRNHNGVSGLDIKTKPRRGNNLSISGLRSSQGFITGKKSLLGDRSPVDL
jgi:hypothetical protein